MSKKLWLAPVALVVGAAAATPDTLIMEDGRRVRGELVSVNRNVVVFDELSNTQTRARRLRVDRDEVRRINLRDDEFDDDGTTDGGFGFPSTGYWGRDFVVRADQQWTDTGLSLRSGDVFYVTADGFINWGPNRSDGPQGEASSPYNASRPIPNRAGGALIGRIGNGEPFYIGPGNMNFRASHSGRLYLGVNDDYLRDNSGSFRVRVDRR
jgi:hypothetical protein